ncbi:MAG TPA: PHP domain-containing protein [Bacteroidales bacterium]|nr:PHP domain-containing protein [Bacteroidales bacterium]
MIDYRADLHIHTVLSPCGDLEMSPAAIIHEACRKGIDIIGISDHNSTRHAVMTAEIGRENGIFVLPGVEINTEEEVHCLAFFENSDQLDKFQAYLDDHLPDIANDPVKFGYQVVLDRKERIIYEEGRLLFNAIKQPLELVEQRVHALGGLFIPAHIDRPKNSIMSQLGFFPRDLPVDAVEISRRTKPGEYLDLHPEIKSHVVITSSDAHYLADIGAACTTFRMKSRSFDEIRKAFMMLNGREVIAV